MSLLLNLSTDEATALERLLDIVVAKPPGQNDLAADEMRSLRDVLDVLRKPRARASAAVVACIGYDGMGCGKPAAHCDVCETGASYGPCCGGAECCAFMDGADADGWTRAPLALGGAAARGEEFARTGDVAVLVRGLPSAADVALATAHANQKCGADCPICERSMHGARPGYSANGSPL